MRAGYSCQGIPCYRRHLYFVSDMGKRSFIRCYPEIQRMGTCVMTTASDVSDSNGGENIWKELRNCGIES